MDYENAVKTAVFQRVDAGTDTIAVTPLILANLADKLFPDSLGVSNGNFLFKGERLDGMTDLVPFLAIPGVIFKEPLYASTPGSVGTKEFPKVLSKPFEAKALFGTYLDGDEKEFFDSLTTLWDKVKGAAFFTLEQHNKIETLIKNGIAPIPVVADIYGKFYGTVPLPFRAPVQTSEARAQAWTNICTAFADANKAFGKKQFKAATELARKAAANAELWDSIYKGVEAVRDAPFTAAKAVGSAFWEGIGPYWKTTIVVGALVGVAWFTFPFWRAAVKGK